jgi:hypothetical protein
MDHENKNLLTVRDMADLFRTTEGAIRTAVWRQRQYQIDPGFPPPFKRGRKLLWLADLVYRHLSALSADGSGGSESQPDGHSRPGRPRK